MFGKAVSEGETRFTGLEINFQYSATHCVVTCNGSTPFKLALSPIFIRSSIHFSATLPLPPNPCNINIMKMQKTVTNDSIFMNCSNALFWIKFTPSIQSHSRNKIHICTYIAHAHMSLASTQSIYADGVN